MKELAENKIKALNLSGGATKISGLAAAATYIMRDINFRPDIISGVSAGAILSLPLALEKYDVIKEEVLSFSLDDFFKKKPVNKKGKVTIGAILRLITGKPALGDQSKLKDILRRVVSKEEYTDYLTSNKPETVLGTVDFRDGSTRYFHVKKEKLTYEQWQEAVLASSSIPVFTNPVKFDNHLLYDGGVRDHIATVHVMKNFNLEENISIFSRPKDYKLKDLNWKPKNVMDVLNRFVDISNIEVSKSDEEHAELLAKEKNIINKVVYLNSIMESLYDTDPTRLKIMYEDSYKETIKQLS